MTVPVEVIDPKFVEVLKQTFTYRRRGLMVNPGIVRNVAYNPSMRRVLGNSILRDAEETNVGII